MRFAFADAFIGTAPPQAMLAAAGAGRVTAAGPRTPVRGDVLSAGRLGTRRARDIHLVIGRAEHIYRAANTRFDSLKASIKSTIGNNMPNRAG
jgi:hypothetical protein